MAKPDISQDYLHSILHYDPMTGEFVWRANRGGKACAGSIAGTIKDNGYVTISVNSRRYYAHRLAWLYIHGVWPCHQLDHIDGDKTNNTIMNLREATHSQNNACRPHNVGVTGLRGVTPLRNRYIAQIKFSRKRIHLGVFDTPEEAHAAYCKAAQELHGEFARHSLMETKRAT